MYSLRKKLTLFGLAALLGIGVTPQTKAMNIDSLAFDACAAVLAYTAGKAYFWHKQRALNHMLLEAAKNGYLKTVQRVLSLGAHIEATERTISTTTTHFTCHYFHLIIPMPDLSNPLLTPLHLACQNGHSDIAEYLLNKGANIEAKDANRKTPLELVSGMLTNLKVLQLLISRGACVSARLVERAIPRAIQNFLYITRYFDTLKNGILVFDAPTHTVICSALIDAPHFTAALLKRPGLAPFVFSALSHHSTKALRANILCKI
jgi:hypothetical protein